MPSSRAAAAVVFVLSITRSNRGLAARGNDRFFKAHLPAADVECVRVDELSRAGDDLDLAALGHRLDAARELADDFVFPGAQFFQVYFGLAESDAVVGHRARF